MRTYLAVLILSAFATYFLTPLARWLAFRVGALDLPSERKIHTHPMARLGGLAMFGGFCFPWIGFSFLDNRVTRAFQAYESLFITLMLGAGVMLALGAYDDMRGVRPSRKLLVQLATASALYLGGFRINTLSNPFGAPIQLSLLAFPFSVLWMVAITNAINLLDELLPLNM